MTTVVEDSLETILRNSAKLYREANGCPMIGSKFCSLEEWVLKYGRVYRKSRLPAGMRRGRRKQCYQNARAASERYGLVYVEGYAASENIPLPIQHGWCWDGTASMQAIDVTTGGFDWYFGVAFHVSASRPKHDETLSCLIDDYTTKWRFVRMAEPELEWSLWTPPACGLDWTVDDLAREQEIVDAAIREIAF